MYSTWHSLYFMECTVNISHFVLSLCLFYLCIITSEYIAYCIIGIQELFLIFLITFEPYIQAWAEFIRHYVKIHLKLQLNRGRWSLKGILQMSEGVCSTLQYNILKYIDDAIFIIEKHT